MNPPASDRPTDVGRSSSESRGFDVVEERGIDLFGESCAEMTYARPP